MSVTDDIKEAAEINRLRADVARLKREAETSAPKRTVNKVAELIESSGIDLEEVGSVKAIRLNKYQSLTKDDDGEAHIHDLEAVSVVLSPKWAEGPKWQPVDQAKPTVVKNKGKKVQPLPRVEDWRVAVILPDPQIGYRQYEDDTLDPFHDERAMDVALQIIENVCPDVIVNLGDFLDLPEQSRFTQEPSFARTTQKAIDRGHRFLAEQQAAGPLAEVVLLAGNHDMRLENLVLNNAKAAYGLKRAGQPDEWPVLSIPYLLRLDELGVTYVDGYPAATYYLNDRLACIHGFKVKSGSSTVAAVLNDEVVSIIHGHIHRHEMIWKTRRDRNGGQEILAATPGCLCRTDGAVPSTKGAVNTHGKPVLNAENWQQGLAVVTYQADGDAEFDYEPVRIKHGRAIFRGGVIDSGGD